MSPHPSLHVLQHQGGNCPVCNWRLHWPVCQQSWGIQQFTTAPCCNCLVFSVGTSRSIFHGTSKSPAGGQHLFIHGVKASQGFFLTETWFACSYTGFKLISCCRATCHFPRPCPKTLSSFSGCCSRAEALPWQPKQRKPADVAGQNCFANLDVRNPIPQLVPASLSAAAWQHQPLQSPNWSSPNTSVAPSAPCQHVREGASTRVQGPPLQEANTAPDPELIAQL